MNMRKKKIFVIVFLLCFAINIYTVSAINTLDAKKENTPSSFISNIKNFIIDNTPTYIKKSVNSATAMTESFRIGLANLSEKTKINLTSQIKKKNVENHSSDNKEWKNKLTLLLQKIELFFTNLSFLILNSKTAFYVISIILFILFIRFIWIRIL